MRELRLTSPLSWLDGIDPRTGRITQPDHPQRGESVAGKIVYLPHSVGSTVGAYTFFSLRKYGTAPSKIVLEEPDSITISAELAGIPVEIKGRGEVRLEDPDIPEEFRSYLEKEASISEAKGFIKVKSVHISGVSYATIGEAGREWLKEMSERARFRVPATTNPTGMDLARWREMGIPESFARGQLDIVESLIEMGALPSFTCTPYLTGNVPYFGEHISWGESSAVAYVNSVIGARSNREGGTKTIVSAVTGYTPLYGRHLDENRRPTIEVRPTEVRGLSDYYALAFLVGKEHPNEVPIYRLEGSLPEMKALSAAGAASGSIDLFYVPGISPTPVKGADKRIEVSLKDLRGVYEELSTFDGGTDLVVLGCPHLSLQEFRMLAEMVRGRKASVRFWLFTSRALLSIVERSNLKAIFDRFGAEIWADTCMVVSPLEEIGIRKVTTNSAKAAKYLRTLRGLEVEFMDLKEIVMRYSTLQS